MRDENRRSDMGEALSGKLLSKLLWLKLFLPGLFLLGVHESVLVKASDKQVTFEKVHEKTYDEFIRDIVFDSVVKDGEEQIYCRVIWLDEKEVQFLNEKGEIVSTKSLAAAGPQEAGRKTKRRATFSRDGNFAAVHEYVIVYGGEIPSIGEEHCTIFDKAGQQKYKIEAILQGSEGEDQFLISDKDGSAVSTRFTYGPLDFYSPEGGVKTVPLFGELGRGRGGPGYAAFSQDGEYLAVLIQYVGKRPTIHSYEADEVWIMLFDRSRNELWRRKVDERQIGNMVISGKGEYVFFKAFTIERTLPKRGEPPPDKGEGGRLTSVTLDLYDKKGNQLSFNDTSLFVFGSFCFSLQAEYVALAGGNRIRLMRTKDGSTVFQKELPGIERIRSMLFSRDGRYLILGRELSRSATRVSVVDMDGEVVWEQEFPRLKGIVCENGFLAFWHLHGYEIYRETVAENTEE